MGLLTPFKWAILMVGTMCTPKVKAVSAHMGFDDAEKFISEMHDPCARSRCLQERTTQKHL